MLVLLLGFDRNVTTLLKESLESNNIIAWTIGTWLLEMNENREVSWERQTWWLLLETLLETFSFIHCRLRFHATARHSQRDHSLQCNIQLSKKVKPMSRVFLFTIIVKFDWSYSNWTITYFILVIFFSFSFFLYLQPLDFLNIIKIYMDIFNNGL